MPGVANRAELRAHLVEHGAFSRAENERIWAKYFEHAPRHLFRETDRRFGLTKRRLCDVGCSYGENLVFCAPGSYGLEVVEPCVAFARSIGLEVHARDVVAEDVRDLPPAEAIWCSAVLEHVESTHTLLRKLHSLLEPGGLLALYAPTIPLVPAAGRLPRVGKLARGYQHSDHINAFVPQTLRFDCERAGFRTVDVSPLYPRPFSILERIPPAKRLVGFAVYVGTAIAGWEYGENATRRVERNARGFRYEWPEAL
jgi:SAM-dependent methyltransferase